MGMKFIGSTSGAGLTPTIEPPAPWVRPDDWLDMPAVSTGQKSVVLLVAVFEHSPNYITLSAQGAYTVNWGDGSSSVNASSGVVSHKEIAWADISAGTLSERGYRQALVTVTPQGAGSLTSISLTTKHTSQPVYNFTSTLVLEMQVSGSAFTTINMNSSGATLQMVHNLLERITFHEGAKFTSGVLGHCYSLQSIEGLNTTGRTSFAQMFQYCRMLHTIPPLQTATCTSMLQAFQYSGVEFFEEPLVLPACTDMGSMFYDCKALRHAPEITTDASLTTVSGMFFGCTDLESVELFDTSAVTVFATMFQGCANLKEVPLFNTGAGTNFSNMFNGCRALRELPLFDLGSAVFLSGFCNSMILLEEVPQWDTSAAQYFDSMFESCKVIKTIPALDTSAALFLSRMFYACDQLEQVPVLNAGLATQVGSMFRFCPALREIPAMNFAAATTVTDLCAASYGIRRFRATGLTRGFSVTQCAMSAAALNELFTNLGTASGAQTITATSNPGSATCDPTIATAKGWTVSR